MGVSRVIDAIKYANRIIREHLEVKPGEEVVLVADPETDMEMVYALAGIVESVGAEYTIAIMPSRGKEKATDLTRFISKGLEAADVIVGLTKASGAPCYSDVVARLLKEKKIRDVSMVLRNMDNWTKGAATADYKEVYRIAERLSKIWGEGEGIHIITSKGTDFHAKITKDKVMDQTVIIEAGLCRWPGREAAFSDGECSQRPREGTAEGVILVDGPIANIGTPDQPIRIEVKKGRVVDIQGGAKARELKEIVRVIENADNIAEIGIGVNPNALRTGDFEEEKKAAGNVHIALGDDGFYGGRIKCGVHMDMVVYEPTVKIDDRIVVKSGKLLV